MMTHDGIRLNPEDYKEKQKIKIQQVQVLKKDIFTDTSIKQLLKIRQEQNHSINPEAMINLIEGRRDPSFTSDRMTTESIDQVFDVEQHFKNVSVNSTVTSFAPKVFRSIREMDGIDEHVLMRSIDPRHNRFQIFKVNDGQKHTAGGKSGSFFFFTQDRKYIVKSMKESEVRKLLKILQSKLEYLKYHNSLLSRVYGIYKVKMKGVMGIYLCLQKNAIQI